MTAPQNIIIKEPGPFYDQPHWVEDYYNTAIKNGATNHARIAYGPVTNHLRYRHDFPSNAEGVVITFSDPYNPEKGRISGFILDSDQYERFTQFLHNGFRIPDKNNFVLIDDIVATLVHNDIFDNKSMTLDSLYDLVRKAVYSDRPHSGPDDVWVDNIIECLYNEDIIPGDRTRNEVETLFRSTFESHVYGHTPKPEPTASFTHALQSDLEALGYSTRNPEAPSLAETIRDVASREPYSPWLHEYTPSPLRDAGAIVRSVKETLYELSYIKWKSYSSEDLDRVLHQAIFQPQV